MITNRRNKLIHFPTLSAQSKNNYLNRYSILITDLKLKFENKFEDFKRLRSNFSLSSMPFSTDINSLPEYLQMESCGLQCDLVLKEKIWIKLKILN